MSQEPDQTKEQNSYEDQFASSSANEGAVTLPTSINDNEFQLVYQAKEESVGGTKLRMAKNIVDFAKSYRCSHVLLIDGSCWVSPDKGVSVLAQIEGNEKLDNYDYVTVPLDHAVYIAKINDGIVVEEKVRPIDQAISYLQNHKHAEIAILAGGHAYEQLASHQFIVNCDLTIFTWESEAANYRFKAINLVLITNQLFHKRLFIPALMVMTPLLIIAFLFSPLYDVKLDTAQRDTRSMLDLDITPKSGPIVKPVPKVPQTILENSASQLLAEITPWVTGKTINFLRTCRLKTVEISKRSLSFEGERMSNIKKNQLGGGAICYIIKVFNDRVIEKGCLNGGNGGKGSDPYLPTIMIGSELTIIKDTFVIQSGAGGNGGVLFKEGPGPLEVDKIPRTADRGKQGYFFELSGYVNKEVIKGKGGNPGSNGKACWVNMKYIDCD
jgi:hypothetical protein